MRTFPIIVGLALSSCGVSNSATATDAAAKAAVQREFGANAVVSSAVITGSPQSMAMCGYVASAEALAFPTAAFIWTAERFDVSRWNDPQYARFDRRALKVCGATWVAPMRVPALS